MGLFDILMVIALGVLSGTILGLAIGWASRRQGPRWAEMSPADRKITLALILLFSVACTAGLAWYALA